MLLRLEDLNTEQKIGMLLCARNFSEEKDLEYTLDLIRNHALGCVQAPYNKLWIDKIKAVADYPILIINDMEAGYPASEFPPVNLMTLSACGKPEYLRAFARVLVADAQRAGFNGTWGPVIDILSGDGPISVPRSFSDDPQQVAEAAEEIAQVFANNHFLSCGKHYPGGINQFKVDGHMASVPSYSTKEELVGEKFIPYLHLLKKGLLPTIMVGHTVHKMIDPEYPASLSKKTIDLIRELGFDGVCFTDSLAMMAILQKYGEENILGMAVAAGNDIILPNYRNSTRKNYEMLLQNYRDGAFTEERLNEAVRRVLAAQAFVGGEPEKPDLPTQEDLDLYNSIAKDCITAITDPGVDAALPADNRDRLFVIVGEEKTGDLGNLTAEIHTQTWYHPDKIEQKIRKEFPDAEIVYLPEYPSAVDNERVLLAATRHKEVVCVTFCTTSAYLGTDCMTRRVESVINALILSGKVSAVLHFGNPFAQKPIYHVPRRLFGYKMPPTQLHAIEVLAGKLPAKGKLPFKVEFS